MSMAVKKTSYSAVEDVELLLPSSEESEDSEYDSAAEEMFIDGRDQLLDRTFPELEDSDWEPEGKIPAKRKRLSQTTKKTAWSTLPPFTASRAVGSSVCTQTDKVQLHTPSPLALTPDEDTTPSPLALMPDEEDIKPSLLALKPDVDVKPLLLALKTDEDVKPSLQAQMPGEDVKSSQLTLMPHEEDVKPTLLAPMPGEEAVKPSLQALVPVRQPGPQHRQPGPQHRQPGPQHRQPGPQHRQPGPQHRQPGPQHRQPGPQHRQPGPQHRTRRAESPVDFWTLPEPESSDSDREPESPAKRKTLPEPDSDSDWEPERKRPAKRKRSSETTNTRTKSTLPPRSFLSTPTDTLRWHTPDEEDTEPPPLAFRPVRQPGPHTGAGRAKSPLDFFKLFFTDVVIKALLNNTNAYGSQRQQGKKEKWKDFTFSDMFSFLSIVIYMGLVKLPQIVDYWKNSRTYNISFPSTVMSRNKFLNMCRSLHLCSLEADAQNQAARGTAAYDRVGKIKPLYTQIVEACKRHYQPGQQICIDERMVAPKARISLKQYVKNKPTKWGYKLFVLADSATGYTWNFHVHDGKSCTSGKGLSYDTVMALMDFEHLGTGYHLYVDNFYTSSHLFRDLLANEIGACGAIPRNRVGFPKTTQNDFAVNAPRGSVRWIRDAELLFVKWKDTQEFVMCSTIHTASYAETVCRRVKKGDKRVTVDVPIPSAVKDYNKHMGGVDLSDAFTSHYNVLHKTKKWYRTFFYHFVDIAIVNAYILYKHCRKDRPMSQIEFRDTLVQELADSGSGSTSQKSTTQRPAAASHKAIYFSEGQIIPKECAATKGRRNCSLCHRKTPVGCETCEVPLCFVPLRNCYGMWHKKHGL